MSPGNLNLLLAGPALGALVVLLLGSRRPAVVRTVGILFSVLPLLVAIPLVRAFDPTATGFQLIERHAWMPNLHVEWVLGIDALGLVAILLAAIVFPVAVWTAGTTSQSPALRTALFLLLESAVLGVFTALNFIPWFLFWELSLVPAFFLIKLWGGPDRGPAAYQFFVYTMVGSVAMLLGFLAVAMATHSFSMDQWISLGRGGRLEALLADRYATSSLLPTLIFAGILLGFAVKVPLFPFHTWLPDAYAEAPSAVTMVLTGVLSKMGLYGFLRLLWPLFPGLLHRFMPGLLAAALAGVVFSAFSALAQKDIKRMLAYSSVNHLGYCLVAVFSLASFPGHARDPLTDGAAALDGALLQFFNHGITAAMLFGMVALLESRSGGLRGMDEFGGLRRPMPVFSGFLGIALFASLGLPGLSGFVGEFLILKGVWGMVPWAALVCLPGLLITAVFLLTFWKKVFHGPVPDRWKTMPDLSLRERLVYAPMLALLFVIGLCPQLLLQWLNPMAVHWIREFLAP